MLNFWKVQAGEFVVILKSSQVIRKGSGLYILKSPNINMFSTNNNCGLIFPIRETDTLIFVFPTGQFSTVHQVLGASANPEVGTSIIQAITIYMINIHALRCVHNKAVHTETIVRNRIVLCSFFPGRGVAPLKTTNQAVIIGIDQSRFPLRQLDSDHCTHRKEGPAGFASRGKKERPMDWQSSRAFAPAKVSIGQKESPSPDLDLGAMLIFSIIRSQVRHFLNSVFQVAVFVVKSAGPVQGARYWRVAPLFMSISLLLNPL